MEQKKEEYQKRDWAITIYTKLIRISDRQMSIIKAIKGKKTLAGKLEEIIDNYVSIHNLKDYIDINKKDS